MIILGIETSCDETALALIETRGVATDTALPECRIIASLIHSQAELHSPYGGVFPTLAKREHGKNIVPLFHRLLEEWKADSDAENLKHVRISDDKFKETIEPFRAELEGQNPELFESFQAAEFLKDRPDIDRIAVTEGPGLEPALWVGINFARMLGQLWNIPIIPIDHMEGHIVGSLIDSELPQGKWQEPKELPIPSIALLISGGHTELIKVSTIGSYEIIGKTKDDAVGEAFDKSARLLGLPYPGGPQISKLAESAEDGGIVPTIKLPRPMMNSRDLDFSFSGLKTAVLYAVRSNSLPDGKITERFRKEMTLEFEMAVTETLDTKLRAAIEEHSASSVIIGGGVAANVRLRKAFTITAQEYGIPLFMPGRNVSGDNALMIALAATCKSQTPSRSLKAHGTKSLSSRHASRGNLGEQF